MRALKDIGWTRLLGERRAGAAVEHGAEPVRAARRRRVGRSARRWFSTGSMLARMNFASTLAANQRFKLRDRGAAACRDARDAAVLRARSMPDGAARQPASRPSSSNYLRATGPWTGSDAQLQAEGPRPRPPVAGTAGVPVRMKVTRRQFVKGGVAAFTVTFAAPELPVAIWRGRRARASATWSCSIWAAATTRSACSIPYNDPFYYSRRPDDCRAGRQRAADRRRSVERRARPASAPHRAAGRSSTRDASRSSSAPATRTRAARISRAPTSGRRRTRRTPPGSAGSAAISTRCPRRSIR